MRALAGQLAAEGRKNGYVLLALTALAYLVVPLSYSIPGAPAVMLLLGIAGLRWRSAAGGFPDDLSFLWRYTLGLFFLLVVVDFLNGDLLENIYPTLAEALPLVFIAPVAFALRRLRISPSLFEVVAALALIVALLHVLITTGIPKPGVPSKAHGFDLFPGTALWPGPFGFAIVTWILLVLLTALKRTEQTAFRLFCAGIGVVTVVIIGSRTATGALGATLIAAIAAAALTTPRSRTSLVAAVGLFVLGAAVLIATPILDRVLDLIADARMFIEEQRVENTATGLRFAMWSTSIEAFKESPLLGHGYARVLQAVVEVPATHGLRLADQPHLHNEFLQYLVGFGLPGGVFAIAFYGLFYIAGARQQDPARRLFAYLVPVLVLVYGLGEIAYGMMPVFALLCFLIAFLFAFPSEDGPLTDQPPRS